MTDQVKELLYEWAEKSGEQKDYPREKQKFCEYELYIAYEGIMCICIYEYYKYGTVRDYWKKYD